ncbi:MAG: alpha/beta hydrolase [Rothia sp. (in: high G+C Gram-positive bacteria)]|nr:alpha/beta hydrolase [Rothia sp. (in: high G+C Gram-positive bacteria)]
MKTAAKLLTCAVVGAYIFRRRRYLNRVAPGLKHPLLYLPIATPVPALMRLIPARLSDLLPATQAAEKVEIKTIKAGSPDPDHQEFQAVLYQPSWRSQLEGAILWIQGTGHLVGNAYLDQTLTSHIAEELGVPVLSAQYRPANGGGQFPGDLNECYAAYRWLQTQSEELGFKEGNIAVAGSSAGGGLAAALVQKAADRGKAPAFQALAYPMLDHRSAYRARSANRQRGRLLWTHNLNSGAWQTYLRDQDRANLPPYASPAQYDSFAKLPPTWIGVGDLDLFYDEDLAYAKALRQAGVATELHIEKGMYHAADSLVPQAEESKDFRGKLVDAISEALSKNSDQPEVVE